MLPTTPQRKSIILGLTGGIASGKSTVALCLVDSGFTIIDADKLGHQLLWPDSPIYTQLIDTFGSQIIEDGGAISRAKLGAIVFASQSQLEQLNSLCLPQISTMILAKIEAIKQQHRPYLVAIDAALLFQTPLWQLCNEIWIIKSHLAEQRLMDKRSLSLKQAQQRLASQDDFSADICQRATIIYNNHTMQHLKQQVQSELAKLLA